MLSRPGTEIGRRSDCDITVPDQSVSRLHARVQRVPDGYAIEDAGSANGTVVNDVQISAAVLLADGDIVRIGNASFAFHAAAPAIVVPPGAMTMVSDPGEEPSPFGNKQALLTQPSLRVEPPAPRQPMSPADRPVPQPARPAQPAGQVGPPGASVSAVAGVGPVRHELAQMERDLGPFIQRLNSLAASVGALQGQLAGLEVPAGASAVPPSLRAVAAKLEAGGGLAQCRELQGLLDALQSAPTDARLLSQLAAELPTITRLLQAYLRALELARDWERPQPGKSGQAGR